MAASSVTAIILSNFFCCASLSSDTLPRGKASYLSAKLSQGGGFYATVIYGISAILVVILVIDSVFCALKEIYLRDSEIFEDIFL